MSRDWETHVYFEHVPLTAALLDPLLDALAAAGLIVDQRDGERFPALAALSSRRGTHDDGSSDLDELLRSREPPVGAGYGVLPFRVERIGLPSAAAYLTFSRPDRATGLDGVTLVVAGELFLPDESAAHDVAFEWMTVLASRLPLLYGWADWETATFLVAAPSRRDVRAGRVPRMMRFNAFGAALATSVPAEHGHERRRLLLTNGAVIFERAAVHTDV